MENKVQLMLISLMIKIAENFKGMRNFVCEWKGPHVICQNVAQDLPEFCFLKVKML